MGGDGALTVPETAFLQTAELHVSGDLVLRARIFLIGSGSKETRGSAPLFEAIGDLEGVDGPFGEDRRA